LLTIPTTGDLTRFLLSRLNGSKGDRGRQNPMFLNLNPGMKRFWGKRKDGRRSIQSKWDDEVRQYLDKYYALVGKHSDELEDLITSAQKKGIEVKEGFEPEFKPNKKSKGTIIYTTGGVLPTKRWSFKEEFLHSLVEQSRKKLKIVQPEIDRMKTMNKKAAERGEPLPFSAEQIARLTPKILKDISRIKKEIDKRNLKAEATGRAAEEVFVKEWMLKHPKLGEIGEAERTLLETQIERLRKYGLSRGY